MTTILPMSIELTMRGDQAYELAYKSVEDRSGIKIGSSYFAITSVARHSDRVVTAQGREVVLANAAAWVGVGLPPIGTKCEIFCHAPHEYWAHHVGEVEIVAHSRDENAEPTAVYRVHKKEFGVEYHALHGAMFRPIRTAAQIAAEKREAEVREKEVNKMVATSSMLDKGWARKVCYSLYDAGYRKLEIVDENEA